MDRFKLRISWVILLLAGLWTAPAGGASPPNERKELTFERDIRPILRAHCFDCHGATEEKKGELDLRLVRFMVQGGKSGPALVSGNAAESLLVRRVQAGEMPPGSARVPASELETLRRWIDEGTRTARPEPESVAPGIGITEEERTFWAFQPIERPGVPIVDAPRVRTPIDAFLAHAMPDGLEFSEDADALTLAHRVSFDLIGIPPDPADVECFLQDPSPDGYVRLVDALLASPAFGERWSRHWLDVIGYADSEGYTTSDAVRPWAYKYRDHVIRSLNRDVPFDEFLVEQLAGDELAGLKKGDWTDRQIELLTATGLLRMAADGTGSGSNTPEARNQVVADTLKIVGSALFGLSIGCAQCHDHRYDPVLQTDYYALRAVFEPALDWQRWQTPQERRVSLYTEDDRRRAAEVEAEAKKIADERVAKQARYLEEALEKELSKHAEPLRSNLRSAWKTPAGKRTTEQKALLKKHPSANIHPGVLYQYNQKAADDLKTYDTRIAGIRAKKPVETFVRALVEPAGKTPATRLFHRGDHRQPTQEVKPAVPQVLTSAGSVAEFPEEIGEVSTSGRRLAFARWLTGHGNPITARVLVNRTWLHLFGRGIVATPGDFGRLGSRPSHPKLLDWLAATFRRDGWSLKRLVRSIVLSTAYRQSSYRDPEQSRIDRENQYYWRQSVRRLDAEVLRDRLLATTGRLERTLYGPSVPAVEDETGQVVVQGNSGRRSVYVQARRSRPVALLQAFDAPVMETNCESRPASTVATQSLMLMNGGLLLDQAALLADRASREANEDVDIGEGESAEKHASLSRKITAAWRLAYGRRPGSDELESAMSFIQEQVETLKSSGVKLPEKRGVEAQAMTNLCQMLLISNEFLYVE